MWECHKRQTHEIKSFVRSAVPYKRPLSFENLLSRIRKGEFFGYVHCDLRTPEYLRGKFESSPPIFKNKFVSRSDLGDFMEKYAEENKTDDSTSENVNIQFSSQTRYNYHTAFKVLFGSWITMWPKLSLWSVQSKEMLL